MFAGLPADSTRNDTYSLYYYRDRIELCQDTVLESMAKKDEVPLLDSTVNMPVDLASTFHRKSTFVALKTNLLYDALTLLNYSVEVPIGKHFSALLYHQVPWWTWGQNNHEYCIRFMSLGTEAKWWFWRGVESTNRRDKLTGHYLGVYAESGKWDFQWKRSICTQGEHWSVGLSYGYAMPIGKYFNLEFSLSVGYASIPYRGYIPNEDYSVLWRDASRQGRWNYFGPTKAQVSLVVPITMKSRKKGGGK